MNYRSRQEFEDVENKMLAPYACRSQQTRGRVYPEEEHPVRTAFQRDRDRIVHSRAFRRLEYKTQVFVNHEGDHYRTRLTHSMEVAQISRNVARTLRLNEDLTEAIALAHDVGHPPFGHSGEKALDVMMKDAGGFEHNRQSLRVLEKLEKRYPQFDGLNLTWEVRDGLQKHRSATLSNPSSLEAQVVDISDDIAYLCHDVDDGLTSQLISEKDLAEVEFWMPHFCDIQKQFPQTSVEIHYYYTVRSMINALVTDLIHHSSEVIMENKIERQDQIARIPFKVINFSSQISQKVQSLKNFLFSKLYTHPQVQKMNHKAMQVVYDLFGIYMEQPELLNQTTQAKVKESSLQQVVCDYIAGMTDRFALNEHKRLFELDDKI